MAVLLICAAALALPGAASAGGGSVVTVFAAYTGAGKPTLPVRGARGYCWTGSIAAPRRGAWRCFVGNDIHDPCFSSARAAAVVVCPNPQLTLATEIHLTRPLPRSMANHAAPGPRSRPWLVELGASRVAGTTGARCEIVTGATSVLAGVSESYFCAGRALRTVGLWGAPAKGPRGLSIRIAPDDSRTLAHAARVPIVHAWV